MGFLNSLKFNCCFDRKLMQRSCFSCAEGNFKFLGEWVLYKFIRVIFWVLTLYHSYLLSLDDILIFYHIPKTGGTTVTALLNQQFNPQEICWDNFYYEVEKRTLDNLSQFKFFRGHFFFNSNLQYLANAKRIIFLRNPVDRVLSEQRFCNMHYEGRESDLYHEHFLPVGKPIETISNHQCLFLSSFDRNDPSVTPEMHLASAKQNLLNEFFFVGLTEHLDKSLQILYSLMGWQVPNIIPKFNATTIELENINEQVLEEIKQRNLLDIELYEFAKDLFECKWGKSMSEEIANISSDVDSTSSEFPFNFVAKDDAS